MLCISRNVKERIIIGDDIEIEILSIDRQKVNLGFIAPRTINIVREEIRNKPQKQKKPSSIKYKHEKPIIVE